MDKIFSARVDESIVHKIQLLAQSLHTSKKNIIESAILLYTREFQKKGDVDPWKYSFGAWERKESARQLVDKFRLTFDQSVKRHQK